MQEYIKNSQVYFALKYKLISDQDLLEYLFNNPVDIIAYRHFLLRQKELGIACPNQQISSSQHFFTLDKPEYILLYAVMGFSLNIPYFENDEVGKLLAPGTIKLYTDPNFASFIGVITGQTTKYTTSEEIEWALVAREYTHLTPDISMVLYITYDALDEILPRIQSSITRGFYETVLLHCQLLQNNQPELWVHLVNEYTSLFKQLYSRNLVCYIPDCHSRLLNILPQLFPEEFKKFTPLTWKIYHLPITTAAYHLGFPLNFKQPIRDDLIPALLKLSEIGIDEYCDKFYQENKNFMVARIKIDTVWTLFKQYPIQFVNERDTLHEDVFGYSPYDVIILPDGEGRFFILTFPELPSFIEHQKNHWTNKPLPLGFIDAIKSQFNERTELNFPVAQPLRDLLRYLETTVYPICHHGTRFDIYEDDNSPPSRERTILVRDRRSEIGRSQSSSGPWLDMAEEPIQTRLHRSRSRDNQRH